jgi:hypothetical protein
MFARKHIFSKDNAMPISNLPNHPHDFWLEVLDPQRVADFTAVFGSPRVPIKSPVVSLAGLPGKNSPTRIYELALDQITPDQRRRLIEFIAAKFHLPGYSVEEDLDAIGMPILAENTVITIDHAQRWL